MSGLNFRIEKKIPNALGRAGVISTPHGDIATPAFMVVGTKATVKAVTPAQLTELGAQCVLANTYHLYLQPGDEVLKAGGGLAKFMNWSGPTMTDSGGFQVFSLGAAYGEGGVSKFANNQSDGDLSKPSTGVEVATKAKLAKVDEDGVTFRSHIDGSEYRLTPEKSMSIQHNIGADIMFAFDECTSPVAPYEYQKGAMERTHRWARRSLDFHRQADTGQALYGIVQGGRFEDLRKESARVISEMDFDGFGIGGSFTKEDLKEALGWVNTILPEDKPRHLLGIGEIADLFIGIEKGIDTFDCVIPTRMARNGTLQTINGRINMMRSAWQSDFSPVVEGCSCYTCRNYTKAYLAHLFRAKEMLAGTLASIHNLYFFVNLVKHIRQSILDGRFEELKRQVLTNIK